MSLVVRRFYLQVGQDHNRLAGPFVRVLSHTAVHRSFLRALAVLRDASHKSVRVVIALPTTLLLDPFDLTLELLDKLQLFIRRPVLLQKLIELELETPHSDFEQFVFPLAVHRTVLIELVLGLLRLVFLLPSLDLFT